MTTRPGAGTFALPPGTRTPAHETCALRRLEVLHDADLSPRRHRQSRRVGDAFRPRGARAERRGGAPHEPRALHGRPSATRSSSARPTRPSSLGPATFVDPRDGQRKPAYLDYDRLARALDACGAEAVWVGWGFVAEHAAFADLCARMGLVFIGPSGDVMRRLGDKISSQAARGIGRRARRALERRRGRHARGRAARRGRHRLPADDQGHGRRRRPRHPPRRRRRPTWRRPSNAHARRRARLRRRHGVHGAAGAGRPAHRGAGRRRPPRARLGARRARLLRAATEPEGHRGSALARALRPTRTGLGARRPRSASRGPPATRTPARWSSCSTTTASSGSWR